MIVKIFFMDVLTQAYAHLEFNSKVSSANAMTWIEQTPLAIKAKETPLLPEVRSA